MEITYDSIKSLIVSAEEDGMMIKLKFKASNQDAPLETVAVVTPSQAEIMKNVAASAAKSTAANMAISKGASALGGALGGGLAGSVARGAGSVASRAASSAMMSTDSIMNTNMTDEKKQAAIVQAFSHLSMYYTHNGTEWQYQQPGAAAGAGA